MQKAFQSSAGTHKNFHTKVTRGRNSIVTLHKLNSFQLKLVEYCPGGISWGIKVGIRVGIRMGIAWIVIRFWEWNWNCRRLPLGIVSQGAIARTMQQRTHTRTHTITICCTQTAPLPPLCITPISFSPSSEMRVRSDKSFGQIKRRFAGCTLN